MLKLPESINWQQYDLRNAMGARRMAWQKRFLFKHFDFYGALGDGFTFGCGMVRLGLLNSTFAYLNGPKGLHRVQFDLPLDTGFQSDYRPIGRTTWNHPFKSDHHVLASRTLESRDLHFRLGKHFHGYLSIDCSNSQTLALNTPIANTGFAYAQKSSGGQVSGCIHLNGVEYVLRPERDGCYHDWTAGFLRRETFWNWACASGRVGDDQPLLSLNLARGVNETSAHENVLWVDGKLHDLPLTLFDYDRDDVQRPWRVYSQCGLVNLKFIPIGSIDDHRNLFVLASRFNQCFGKFEGTVTIKETGVTYSLAGLTGWCEDHYAKW
ncbi:DUF2804 domain-containing protein [Limnobacter parvus]|uniref:DUF2804 domain-containing protein n=1 Tax=Limnobacter parvus TaxID=2939690 RepID=A0ABT1XIG1_9BURK|nr:DUF2804 domain-containing protein [Limnobacter parvus]MCR2747057.1 DUF2804 domain-containing protein [Limnobacter parvus]